MNTNGDNKKGKGRNKSLRKHGKLVAYIIITAVIATVVNQYLPPILPSEQPLFPSITTSPSPNPRWNTGDTQSITVTATPDFQPPYSNNITVTIPNPNSYKCYMVLELEASAGFCFLPITDGLPLNVDVGEGYEYKNVMILSINDFAPQFHLELDIPVYTMNPETHGGTEQITPKVLAVREEK